MEEIPRYKGEFIEFLKDINALKFGEFTLKSGRVSPWFCNVGAADNGVRMKKLCQAYKQRLLWAVNENKEIKKFNGLFGPPYKGIGLAIGTAMELEDARHPNTDPSYSIYWTFNRKEAKGHGDAGVLVGRKIQAGDSLVVMDDVFTTGGTKEEAVELIHSLDAKVEAICIAVDRCEVGSDGKTSAIQTFENKYGIPVLSIVNVHEIMEYMAGKLVDVETKSGDISTRVPFSKFIRPLMEEYLEKYGVKQ